MLAKNQVDQNKIDICINLLNEALTTSAKKSFPCVKIIAKKKKFNKRNHISNSWYTKESKARRSDVRQRSKALSKEPYNKTNQARNAYKTTCRKAEKASRNFLTKQLMEVGANDPKSFWNIIDKMNNWGKSKGDAADRIAPNRWIEHFKNLLNNNTTSPLTSVSDSPASFDPLLDRMISLKELT